MVLVGHFQLKIFYEKNGWFLCGEKKNQNWCGFIFAFKDNQALGSCIVLKTHKIEICLLLVSGEKGIWMALLAGCIQMECLESSSNGPHLLGEGAKYI